MVTFGVIYVSSLTSYYCYSSFFTNHSEKRLKVYFGYLMKDDTSIFILNLYYFITLAILESMSTVFIPVFYMVLSLVISQEFSTWNDHLKKNVTSLDIKNDDNLIAKYIKMYDNLCNNVRLADCFMSNYIGANLFLMCLNICYFLYVTITDWGQYQFLTLFLVYGLVIVYILIAGSTMINSKVSTQVIR